MDETIGRVARGLLSAALGVACAAAHGYGGLIILGAPPAEHDRIALGPGVVAFPEHAGSSEHKVWPIPAIDYYSTLGGFVSTDIGVGWNFSPRADLQAGVRLWPQFGRDDSPPGLPGLPGVPDRLGKAAFANYAPLRALLLQSSLMYGAGRDGDGLMAEIGATSGLPIGDALLAVTLGGSWANRSYRQSFYGVGAADSVASGLPEWNVGAGWQDVNLSLSLDVPLGDRWKLSGQLLGARLLGAAADSPITRSRTQSTLSLTLWYRFR